MSLSEQQVCDSCLKVRRTGALYLKADWQTPSEVTYSPEIKTTTKLEMVCYVSDESSKTTAAKWSHNAIDPRAD
jgi:hypothetical protein